MSSPFSPEVVYSAMEKVANLTASRGSAAAGAGLGSLLGLMSPLPGGSALGGYLGSRIGGKGLLTRTTGGAGAVGGLLGPAGAAVGGAVGRTELTGLAKALIAAGGIGGAAAAVNASRNKR